MYKHAKLYCRGIKLLVNSMKLLKEFKDKNRTRDDDHIESIRLYAKKIYYEGYSCFEKTNGEVQRAEKRFAFGVYQSRET